MKLKTHILFCIFLLSLSMIAETKISLSSVSAGYNSVNVINQSRPSVSADEIFPGAAWIGAISNEETGIPRGKAYSYTVFRNPDYKAIWSNANPLSRQSIFLRKEFIPAKALKSAILKISGLGHYIAYINGKRIGDAEFAPLWSDYSKTVYYNQYDVSLLLKEGTNAIGVLLGNGVYNEQGGRYTKFRISYGAPTMIADLQLEFKDGTTTHIYSDDSWKFSASPITFNSMFGGEDYDARLEQDGWSMPGFNADSVQIKNLGDNEKQWKNSWKPVVLQTPPEGKLTFQTAPPVRIMQRFGIKDFKILTLAELDSASPKSKRKLNKSTIVYNMGQNLAGFPEITLRGQAGDTVVLSVGETLTSEGAVDQRQTGRPHLYYYVLKDDKTVSWHPHFAYYGFQYIQVEGAVRPEMPNPQNLPVMTGLESCFAYVDNPQTGKFECSNPLFNQIHQLILNAIKSNMQGVLTDCPQREKLGWLEQNHLNGPGLMYNFQMKEYLQKIMRDMADAQRENGMIPSIAPMYTWFGTETAFDDFADSPEWGSTFIILPWMYRQFYDDPSMIRKYYPQMKSYMHYLQSRSRNDILSFGLGDWYDYGNFRAGFSRNTPVPLVATAYYYYDFIKMHDAAVYLGYKKDAAFYKMMAQRVKSSFYKEFFDETKNTFGTGSQTSIALPLYVGLVDESQKKQQLYLLEQDIRLHGNRLTTGDIGNRYLFQVLAENGMNELMYLMHNHQETPGYGYQLKFGATTLTEQWDPERGASRNHFMLGQIEEWFYKSLAGIQPGASGYARMSIVPEMIGDLTFVNAIVPTLYGTVSVSWKRDGTQFSFEASIPEKCIANIRLPDGHKYKLRGGSYKYQGELSKLRQ